MDPQSASAMAVAWARFGLGRRGAEPPPDDPRAWLRQQINQPDPGPPGPSSADALRGLQFDRVNQLPPAERMTGRLLRTEAVAALQWRIDSRMPFRERLVAFWSNHFAVAVRQGPAGAVAAAFVREAIRPHVNGSFADMLLAVMRHPAMLFYLDNAQSVGPQSPQGRRSGAGLNENLARECLELHTVSPAAGYTQQDVTAFAAVLTGWSVEVAHEPVGFVFRPNTHEPGAKTVLGRSFPEGEEGGRAALAFLATHPATLHHLALKLARHFTADTPPPMAVARIEAALHDSGGHLGAAARRLIEIPAAWQPATKLRDPQDYVVAALRALDAGVPPPVDLPAALAELGQPLWNPPLPNGWPDMAESWAGPDAMMRRIDWAFLLSGRVPDRDAAALAEAALGPLLRPATRDALHGAGSRREALTLLLTAPEFQRR
jgi:uncharacterized protein (DUF1800 family)